VNRVRYVLLALGFVLLGALGAAVYQIGVHLWTDHLLLHQLVHIEAQRQRAAMPTGVPTPKSADAPAPK